MPWNGMGNPGNHERDHDQIDKAVEWDVAARTADPCQPLEEEIEALEEQIGVLEEGLPQAPGMERAALFKEVTAYRRELDARRRVLRQCRTTSAAQQRL
jgi:hypothetical protein